MEEISLKEIIEILLRGKYIILITTLVALVIGAVVYKIMPEQYKTTASILANPIVNIDKAGNDSVNQFALPNMDITSYRQQFLNNYTMRKTIEELDLRDKDGNYVSYDVLRGMVTVANPDKTNILDVSVSGGDAEKITQIANALGKHFVDYITDVYQTSAGVSAKALAEQIKIEEANLDREAAKLKDYLKSSENMDTLNMEIESLIAQITQYKTDLNDKERAIASDSVSVGQLRTRAGEAAGGAQVSALLTEEALYTGEYQVLLSAGSAAGLEQALFTLKLADVETRLIENSNEKKAIEGKIIELEDRLSDLQSRRAEEQYKYNTIQRDIERAENIYDTYTAQYRQALAIEAVNLGNVNIKFISEAIVPISPNNKNMLLTGGVAGVLGVFIGMFAVLFWGYWVSEGEKPTESVTARERESEVAR